jgi:hypothetical protein
MNGTELSSWWVSWYSDTSLSAFELHSPYWVTGYDADDNVIVCAMVLADDEGAAKEKIRLAYDEGPHRPDSVAEMRWRFCDEHEGKPFSERFPQSRWMRWEPPITCGCEDPDCLGKGS